MEQTEVRATWGQRIRRLRRESELTATAVAQAAGITRGYLHAIEAGQYAPSDEVRIAIARAIGVEPGEIFSYDIKTAS